MKRDTKHRRDQLRQEAIAQYTALLVQARMLSLPSPAMQSRMSEALQAIKTMNLGGIKSRIAHLELILGHLPRTVGRLALNNHIAVVAYNSYAQEAPHNPSPKKRTYSVRPQTKISGQAARFQNCRR